MQRKKSRKNYHNDGRSPETWGMVLGTPPTPSPCSARTLALRYRLRPPKVGGRADVEDWMGRTDSRVWARVRRRRWVREGLPLRRCPRKGSKTFFSCVLFLSPSWMRWRRGEKKLIPSSCGLAWDSGAGKKPWLVWVDGAWRRTWRRPSVLSSFNKCEYQFSHWFFVRVQCW